VSLAHDWILQGFMNIKQLLNMNMGGSKRKRSRVYDQRLYGSSFQSKQQRAPQKCMNICIYSRITSLKKEASGKKTATRIFKRNCLPAPVNIAGLCRDQLYLLQIIV
jgi:hypothetical protein